MRKERGYRVENTLFPDWKVSRGSSRYNFILKRDRSPSQKTDSANPFQLAPIRARQGPVVNVTRTASSVLDPAIEGERKQVDMVLKPQVTSLAASAVISPVSALYQRSRSATAESRDKPHINDLTFFVPLPFLASGKASIPPLPFNNSSSYTSAQIKRNPPAADSGAFEFHRTPNRRLNIAAANGLVTGDCDGGVLEGILALNPYTHPLRALVATC